MINTWTSICPAWQNEDKIENQKKVFPPPGGTRNSSDLSLSIGRGPPCTQTLMPPFCTDTAHTWFSFVGSEVRHRLMFSIGHT